VGACYVLDEPSIGLHSRDTGRLIRILKSCAKSATPSWWWSTIPT
jgi:excinuclease UvrABC ATPase subunit